MPRRRRPPTTALARRRVVSLARALSKLGLASRPEARALVRAGRVQLEGRVVTDPERRVDPDHDDLRVDGRRVRRATASYWLLHKPAGVVTTRRDPEGRPTVYDLLPAGAPFVGPVGRLDQDTTGLLLLTNDTQLAAFLTDPERHVPKVYEVELEAPLGAGEVAELVSGVVVLGRRTLPAEVELLGRVPSKCLRITLVEGRNRQVRRMMEAIGRTVVRLHRTAVGPLRLGTLAVGVARPLTPAEIAALARWRDRHQGGATSSRARR